MRILVEKSDNRNFVSVHFQPDSAEESTSLDTLLGFTGELATPLSDERDRRVVNGAREVASIGGHESQRWIMIPL